MSKYKPQIGDLMYIKRGRWDSLGMIVDRSATSWTIEWFSVNGKHMRYAGFKYKEVKEHHEEFLKLKESL